MANSFWPIKWSACWSVLGNVLVRYVAVLGSLFALKPWYLHLIWIVLLQWVKAFFLSALILGSRSAEPKNSALEFLMQERHYKVPAMSWLKNPVSVVLRAKSRFVCSWSYGIFSLSNSCNILTSERLGTARSLVFLSRCYRGL